MHISKSSRLYGIITAALVTAGCGALYVIQRSKLTAIRELGEGTAEETQKILSATRWWLAIACVMALVTILAALIPGSNGDSENG